MPWQSESLEGADRVFASEEHAAGLSDFGPEVDLQATSVSTTGAASPAVEVTVEDLVFLNVPLTWQEAAAIVVELAGAVLPGASWPDPAHAMLTDTGEIAPAAQVTLRGNPVCHAAALLQRLIALTRLAPAELTVLVNKNIGEPPAYESIDAFQKSLNYFTRPNRLDDTAAVYGRAADMLQKRLLEREFDRLRTKSERADSDGSKSPFALLNRVDPEVLQRALVVLLCLLLVSSGTALVSMALWPATPLSSASQAGAGRNATASSGDSAVMRSGASKEAGLPGASVNAPGQTPSARQPSTPAPAIRIRRSVALESPSPAAPPQTSPRGLNTPSARSGAVAEGDPARDRFWSVTLREVRPDGEISVPGETAVASSHERTSDLFSSADADVSPATLVRPQMPSSGEPATPDQRDSVFDLIIDQDGRVEQVRLVSPGNRFNDRMLIAAAKAWQFQPATRNGQPVRYKLQVRIAP